MHVYIIKCVLDSRGGLKKALELELQAIASYPFGTGNFPESSWRAECALNHWGGSVTLLFLSKSRKFFIYLYQSCSLMFF